MSDVYRTTRLIALYVTRPQGITNPDCEGLGFSTEESRIITGALGTGAGGEITPAEKSALSRAGLSDDEIRLMTGALAKRIKTLGNFINTRWFRSDLSTADRAAIITEFGQARQRAKAALPQLFEALESSDPEIRCASAKAIAQIDPTNSQVIERLIEALSDEDADVRNTVAEVLGTTKPQGVQVTRIAEALAARIRTDSQINPRNFSRSLSRICAEHVNCGRIFLDTLSSSSNDRASQLANSLAEFINSRPGAVDLLASVPSMPGVSALVRRHAIRGLVRVNSAGDGAETASSAIIDSLADSDQAINEETHLFFYRRLGENDETTTQKLVTSLTSHTSQDIRKEIASILGATGSTHPNRRSVIEALRTALKDESQKVRETAAYSLALLMRKPAPAAIEEEELADTEYDEADVSEEARECSEGTLSRAEPISLPGGARADVVISRYTEGGEEKADLLVTLHIGDRTIEDIRVVDSFRMRYLDGLIDDTIDLQGSGVDELGSLLLGDAENIDYGIYLALEKALYTRHSVLNSTTDDPPRDIVSELCNIDTP